MIELEVQPTVETEEVAEWYAIKEQLETIKEKELELRLRIFRKAFPSWQEGVNKEDLPGTEGWVLKATGVINRKVDEALLATLGEELTRKGVPVKDLIRWKPEITINTYRKLTDEQRREFDALLIIKEGTPQMEVAFPKRK